MSYECFNSGLDDAEMVVVVEEESANGPDFSASRWAAIEKRRQKAGSRIPAIPYATLYRTEEGKSWVVVLDMPMKMADEKGW